MKESTKVIGKIYQTTNYERFQFRVDNRPVEDNTVKKLVKSIGEMGQKLPIKVDYAFNVLDGQHRLKACMSLNIPVTYIIDNDLMSTEQIAQLQSTTKKWSASDYAHSFASDEDNGSDYRLYNTFTALYPEFPHSTALLMLSNSKNNAGNADVNFKTGKFKVKSYTKAKLIAETLRKLSIYYKNYNKKGFVSSLVVMINHVDFSLERLLRKMPKRCKQIHDFSKTEDYLDTLQSIYNWNEAKKVYFH